MKYTDESDSGVMIYIPSYIKTGSDIQKLIEGDSQTHGHHGDHTSLLLFFHNKESGIQMEQQKTSGEYGNETSHSIHPRKFPD
jgi:hypothetical protein